jgi:peroxiredoxin
MIVSIRKTTGIQVFGSESLRASIAVAGVLTGWLAIGAGLVGVAQAGKAKFNKVLNVGDKAPAWSDLPGVDGKTHSLADYREAKVVVVVFTCNHCPVAKQYAERVAAFVKKYDKEVQVVAISVSHHGADRLDQMKARAAEKAFPYPYLYDESQQSGRAYGATATPHFFVLNGERRIAYMGAFDDNIVEPEKVEKRYLVDAVDAVLAGKEPAIKESLQRGCAIEYEALREK